MKLATVVCSLLLAASSSFAHARPKGQPGGPRGQGVKQQLVALFDADGDGRLDERERHRAIRMLRKLEGRQPGRDPAARRARMLQRFDRNGNGAFDPGELPPKAERRLRSLDAAAPAPAPDAEPDVDLAP